MATEEVTSALHDAHVYGTDRSSWAGEEPVAKQDVFITCVIFGATGDLAAKKTFPCLASLYNRGYLPENIQIIGFGRSEVDDDKLREKASKNLEGSDEQKKKFLAQITYHHGGSYEDADGFESLQKELAKREGACDARTCGRLFYLATPPSVYTSVIQNVKESCTELMVKGSDDAPSWNRVIIEKPFGHDLQSSEELACHIARLFTEKEVYRIDHYLGKELSQNMLVMRFTNQFLSGVWDNKSIANIQVTMKESFGTEGRGGYFDSFGIIRDVMQNHLLQLLALLTMERPVSMHPDDIRDEKTKVIRSMRVVEDEDCVVGQYAAAGDKPGYTDDEDVPDDSTTPTYAVCRLWCDNQRWEGVPMVMKAGKALNEDKTEVRVQFRSQAGFLGGDDAEGHRNEFVMQLKPKNLMYLKMVLKKPGLDMSPAMSELELQYNNRYDEYIPEAYERLILDAVQGNQQHFVRRDELRASWAVFTPLLHRLDKKEGPKLQKYPYGARGVEAGDKLLKDSGYVRSTSYDWSKSKKAQE